MDAESDRSSISAGMIIHRLLSESEDVSAMATKIFPVCITDEKAVLPYIVYRCVKQEPTPAKPQKGYDSCLMAVDCLGDLYSTAVELAESVRSALENGECTADGITLSSCLMTDREEFYEADAYVERLIFTVCI